MAEENNPQETTPVEEPAASPEPQAEAPSQAAPAAPQAEPEAARSLDFVLDVPLRLTVEMGGAKLHVREVLQLAKGSVIELDRMSGEPADVLVNGRLVARGELTVVEDRLAVRIVEVVGSSPIGH